MVNNKKQQVEDIFEEVDKVPVKKQVTKKPQPANKQKKMNATLPVTNVPQISSERNIKTPTKVLLIFVVVVLLGIAYVVISGFFGNDSDSSIITNSPNINSDSNVNITDNNVVDVETNPPEIVTGTADTDGDGLTDEEEKNLGTSLISSDTDSDGLFDREEVEVYKTNPVLRDTDGDGKDDGIEISNGYNPLGDGLLLDLQDSIDNL